MSGRLLTIIAMSNRLRRTGGRFLDTAALPLRR